MTSKNGAHFNSETAALKKQKTMLNQTGFGSFLYGFKGYRKHLGLTIMFIPVVVYFIVFKYIPMYGITLAFKDFRFNLGIMGSPWVGLDNFRDLFMFNTFNRAVRNTIIISLLKLIAGFPMPIILALVLNEVRHVRFKKLVQTISYLPHFLSWVVLAGVFIQLFSPSTGFVNYILSLFNIKPIYFLGDNKWFRSTLVFTSVWKNVGWSSIIYLAAIAGIDLSMYEAAICDGATRFQRMWYITLPSILPTVTVLLILNIGSLLDAGFDQIFNLYNAAVYETADIIDTYVYRTGMRDMKYSLATAVGLFKNGIGFVLVFSTNYITRKISDTGVW
jgi:putative aldouronate transport system permease protein